MTLRDRVDRTKLERSNLKRAELSVRFFPNKSYRKRLESDHLDRGQPFWSDFYSLWLNELHLRRFWFVWGWFELHRFSQGPSYRLLF